MNEAGHRVVIVGGGFAGLHCAKTLRKTSATVTLVDRNNYHLFQPLLYQVATGALSPANISAPLRSLFRHQSNVRVRLGEVVGLDLVKRRVLLRGDVLDYDSLVLAAGAVNEYFGHGDWAAAAPGLKTLGEATEIRHRILCALERAEWETDESMRQELLTFVVIGGGPTGVELVGAIAELVRTTTAHEFSTIQPAQCRVMLLDAGERLLPTYPASLGQSALSALNGLGVEVRMAARVKSVSARDVVYEQLSQEVAVSTRCVLWAAGARGSPLGLALALQAGLSIDRQGRIPVQRDCSIEGHKEVFVAGDLARFESEDKEPLPGIAPVAMQQGRYIGKVIAARIAGKPMEENFRYRDKGKMATVGRGIAVVDLGPVRMAGFFAWITWLFVHLLYIVGFESRLLVLIQWAWSYVTFNRSARLILCSRQEDQSQDAAGSCGDLGAGDKSREL